MLDSSEEQGNVINSALCLAWMDTTLDTAEYSELPGGKAEMVRFTIDTNAWNCNNRDRLWGGCDFGLLVFSQN